MISTVLVGARWLPITALVGFVVIAPVVAMLLVRRRTLTGVLLGLSSIAVLELTLTPAGDPAARVMCAAALPVLSPTSVESLSNILLLAPSTMLAGVLLRRPAVAFGAAVALSAAIETVQALVRVLGRACDTGDLLTNASGALLGGVLALVGLRLASRRGALPVG